MEFKLSKIRAISTAENIIVITINTIVWPIPSINSKIIRRLK